MHDISLILLLAGCVAVYSARAKAEADLAALLGGVKSTLKSLFTRRPTQAPAAAGGPIIASSREFYRGFETALLLPDKIAQRKIGLANLEAMARLLPPAAPAAPETPGGAQ